MILGIALTTAAVRAQWTATQLNPSNSGDSWAISVSEISQAGLVTIAGQERASLWHGSAPSWTDLTPSVATTSRCFGLSVDQQVGYVGTASGNHASLWTGSASSWVDLNPSVATDSYAYGTGSGEQVGFVWAGGQHAALWRGTAASFVDLDPAGSHRSIAFGTDAGRQAGFTVFTGSSPSELIEHAGIWSGSAASWVDLHLGHMGSRALAISGSDVVGFVSFTYSHGDHASLWHDTQSSWIDLSPSGTFSSRAWAVSGEWQAGTAYDGLTDRAVVWHGTAASWEDLTTALPGSWSTSLALGIWTNSVTLSVSGVAFSNETHNWTALLWTRPVCYPNCDYSTASPALDINDFICFQSKFVAGDMYANCDGSTRSPQLNIADFICFMQRFAEGCP